LGKNKSKMTPQRQNSFKKIIAAFLAGIELHTQVVFAGVPVWPGVPPGVSSLGLKSLHLSQKILSQGLTLFHAFPYSNMFEPRGATDLPQGSQSSPERLSHQEEQQMSVLRQLEELQIFQEETFNNRPTMPNSQKEILDGVSTGTDR
jgi:hypothetical protein